MTSKTNASHLARTVLLAGLMGVFLTSIGHAEDRTIKPEQAVLRITKPAAVKPVKFDWLADRGNRARPILVSEVRTPRQIGSGSWICSPAGFGKKSRCYSN